MELKRNYKLPLAGVFRLLERLAQEREQTARTLYLPSGTGEVALRLTRWLGQEPPPPFIREISGSATGAVMLCAETLYLLRPPFPVAAEVDTPGVVGGPLMELLEPDYRLALVLVRLGSFAVGAAEGERLLSSKVGTGLVHGRHKKGGSSQGRFARHREKQMEMFFTRVCAHAAEVIGPHATGLDYVVFGGARTTILALRKQCPFINKLPGLVLPPHLDIPEPRRPVLEAVLADAYTTRVSEWA